MNDQEMIAAPLCDILEPFLSKMSAQFCECIQSYAQQPGALPCDAFPFSVSRSIVQTAVCHVATTALVVPKGATGVVTRIGVQERYPGTLYGANLMVMINDALSPQFSRFDISLGSNLGDGIGTRICLEEQDIFSLLLQCSWTPVVFVGQESTYQQMLYPFQVSGYFQPKKIGGSFAEVG